MTYNTVSLLTTSSIWQVRFLLSDCADSNTVDGVLKEFLQSIDQCSDTQLVHEAVLLVKELSYMHSSVSSLLLEHLKSFKRPSPFLEVLEPIFASQDPTLVADLATTLLEIEDNDEQFCLILGIILELPVQKHVVQVVMRSLRTAVNRFSSGLYSPLLRSSVKCFSKGGADLPNLWRLKLKTAENSDVTVMSTWETLHDTGAEAEKFILEWLGILSRVSISMITDSTWVSITDAFVLLLSLSGTVGSIAARRARSLCAKLLTLELFPFAEVTELVYSLK